MGRQVATAKSPTAWQEVNGLRAAINLDLELALPALQRRTGGVIQSERVNDLSPLWPESHLRDAILLGAKRFVKYCEQMRERYRPLTAEGDFRVSGPYRYKPTTDRVIGFQSDQYLLDHGKVTFYVVGDFVAEFGHLTPAITDDEVTETQRRAVDLWVAGERAGGNDI